MIILWAHILLIPPQCSYVINVKYRPPASNPSLLPFLRWMGVSNFSLAMISGVAQPGA